MAICRGGAHRRAFSASSRAGNTAMALEHSGQGRRNRLLAALTSADHSLLAPYLKELSLKLGSLLQEAGESIDTYISPSGDDFPCRCDVAWARDRDRHGRQRRRGRSHVRVWTRPSVSNLANLDSANSLPKSKSAKGMAGSAMQSPLPAGIRGVQP
jgi:hypothetical protein